MTWADTANGVLKRRNADNTAWMIERNLFEDVRLTTSQTDTTPGRALKVGDFGIGGILQNLSSRDLLADDSLTFFYGVNLVNAPAGAGTAGYVTKRGRDSLYREVTYTPYSGSGRWVNYCNNGTWTGWHRLLTDADMTFADNATALARVSTTTVLSPATLGFAEQPVKTGSAQFVRAANEILMTGIVTDLGLEIGDVIQVTGTTNNNFTMTVEKITDANDINVNYEHRNGAGPLSLTDETAANTTIKRIAKWNNAPLGLGQAWVNVSASRAYATTYTNTTRRPIKANVTQGALSNPSLTLQVGGVTVGDLSAQTITRLAVGDVVPPLSKNAYSVTGNGSVQFWVELR
jgi:hypothetical protein